MARGLLLALVGHDLFLLTGLAALYHCVFLSSGQLPMSAKLPASPSATFSHRLSVAPMLDWTDRHCRYFHRLLAPSACLYSEMITTAALLHSNPARHLDFDAEEKPVALQLGGSDPQALAQCARLGEQWGYDEINLNVGCPSDRVQKGRFGACLMKEPELVAACLAAMRQAVSLPVTVKTRIGVDERESYAELRDFVGLCQQAGCDTVILHARKAWLQGLSPKQNRTVPPLKYEYAYRLKADFPQLEIVLNGGIDSVQATKEHLAQVDGVMIGRAAWNNPWLLAEMQRELFPGKTATAPQSRDAVLAQYRDYCQKMISQGTPLNWLIRPILGLYHALPGNRLWKNHLVSQSAQRPHDIAVLDEARQRIPQPSGSI
jgi:tRNA-dihydrouridine synthase A